MIDQPRQALSQSKVCFDHPRIREGAVGCGGCELGLSYPYPFGYGARTAKCVESLDEKAKQIA